MRRGKLATLATTKNAAKTSVRLALPWRVRIAANAGRCTKHATHSQGKRVQQHRSHPGPATDVGYRAAKTSWASLAALRRCTKTISSRPPRSSVANAIQSPATATTVCLPPPPSRCSTGCTNGPRPAPTVSATAATAPPPPRCITARPRPATTTCATPVSWQGLGTVRKVEVPRRTTCGTF